MKPAFRDENYKGLLLEYCQKMRITLPSFVHCERGPPHRTEYQCEVKFKDGRHFLGEWCKSKATAEQNASLFTSRQIVDLNQDKIEVIKSEMEAYSNKVNYIGLLQERCQVCRLEFPIYGLIKSGKGHKPSFSPCVDFLGKRVTDTVAFDRKKDADKYGAYLILLNWESYSARIDESVNEILKERREKFERYLCEDAEIDEKKGVICPRDITKPMMIVADDNEVDVIEPEPAVLKKTGIVDANIREKAELAYYNTIVETNVNLVVADLAPSLSEYDPIMNYVEYVELYCMWNGIKNVKYFSTYAIPFFWCSILWTNFYR